MAGLRGQCLQPTWTGLHRTATAPMKRTSRNGARRPSGNFSYSSTSTDSSSAACLRHCNDVRVLHRRLQRQLQFLGTKMGPTLNIPEVQASAINRPARRVRHLVSPITRLKWWCSGLQGRPCKSYSVYLTYFVCLTYFTYLIFVSLILYI